MSEARRRKLLDIPNTHNNVHWRRKERKLKGDAAAEFCAHESRTDGTLLRGDALVRAHTASEAKAKRAPSKVLERIAKHVKREGEKRSRRAAKRALREMRRRARMAGKEKAPESEPTPAPTKSAPPAPSLWQRIKGVFGRKAAA